MSHQAQGRDSGSREHHQELNRALSWLLKGADLSDVQWREDCKWSIRGLVMTAILWAWSGEQTLTGRFEQAKKITRRMLGKEHAPDSSYQAFMKLLRKWTTAILIGLALVFREKMERQFADRWRIGRFVCFGVDGSRFELPRTVKNEAYFCAPKTRPARRLSKKDKNQNKKKRRRRKHRQSAAARSKKASNPQMWVTTIWHLGIGLPWSWRLGPSNSSEREHLQEMLGELPKGSLLVADAGFYGYDLWSAVLAAGHQLLVRVGSNVHLLKKLGYVKERNGLVYCWPDHAASKSQPPLVLRLVVVHNGKHPVYLVTSVLDEKEFSDVEVAETYRGRWGIELFYRHVKQTFDRRKLRSHSPDNALREAHWSLLGLWAMTIHAQYQLQLQNLDPHRLSIAEMLRAYRAMMNEYKSIIDKGEDLRSRLKHALKDNYPRKSKASRNYPRKKKEQAAGPPNITLATKAQVKKARDVKREIQKGLTA
jgi:DDE family transposase